MAKSLETSPIFKPDYLFRFRDVLLGAQMLFIAIGALVLVPLLTGPAGLDPSVALFTAGVGTLIFQVITRGKIPVFLGSSFAFLAPMIYGIEHWGLPATLSGLAFGGVAYFLFSLLVLIKGRAFIDRILPPIITGPIIMAIGLILAPVAINMAMGKSGDGSIQLFDEATALIVAFVALSATIAARLFSKGKLKLVPLLVGGVIGYITAYWAGIVDLNIMHSTTWLNIPKFTTPTWHWPAAVLIFPIAAISAIEHIGDVAAISTITGRNFFSNPGVHRSLLGDGIATTFAAMLGGPPNTTYSEVTAGVAITKVYNPAIMTWAAIVAIGLAFISKIGAFLQTIPSPVMGGILILLFGAITVTGLNLLVTAKTDLMKPRNMTIVGIILILPIGGLSIGSGDFAINGIGLGGLLGVLLNSILPKQLPGEDEVEVETAINSQVS